MRWGRTRLPEPRSPRAGADQPAQPGRKPTASPAATAAAVARHGPWIPATGGIHLDQWAAELVGTCLLVFGGLSAVVIDFGIDSPVASVVPAVSRRLLLTGALFAGVGALVTISPLGRRSGAHLNPAVTLAFWLTGHVHWTDLVGYVVAQVAGALVGAAALAVAWGAGAASVHDGVTQPGTGIEPAAAVLIEAAMTAAMILAILVFVSSRRTMRWTPLAVWVVVTVLVWKGAPLTGTSLNPARSIGPAVVSGDFHALWVYLVGPPLGAVVAVVVQRLVLPGRVPLTAKLFHLPHDLPTSLGHFFRLADHPAAG